MSSVTLELVASVRNPFASKKRKKIIELKAFLNKIKKLLQKVEENTGWRQKRCFNLIPSETTPSLLVKICEISDPSGRYAEHRTMKGKEIYFYQGVNFIEEIEHGSTAYWNPGKLHSQDS